MQISHYSPRELPEALHGLVPLALDLRWNWHHRADALWRAVDPELWEATENPWLILETVSDDRLAALAANGTFLDQLREQVAARQTYVDARSWFAEQAPAFSGHIAYFSMEFALSEALPIYSGGLGVLAGDCLKTGCDLGVPIVGIGLLYQQGYFRQQLDGNGEQLEFYPFNEPATLPIVPQRNEQGDWVTVPVELPGRSVRLRAWRVEVGRRLLLLLDSNDPLNEPGDRGITGELYGGGTELRLQQEIALGIGGWRLLTMLGIDCPVCHLNEGHAAFGVLERARDFMARERQPFAVALRATRAGNLFTTHTPVAAGFDRFPPELFTQYFRDYARSLEIEVDELLALGRADPRDAAEPFNMAYLAVRGAGAVNGVSRLHGEVSRRIFAPLFARWPEPEVPVGHVTNGVHMPTWDSPEADGVWTKACGAARWRGDLADTEISLREVDDDALWGLRAARLRCLDAFLSKRLARQCSRRGVPLATPPPSSILQPDALTLGFARRFAEYKRTNLLLHDPERLLRLLTASDRPVQLVIAGKAHPRDAVGKELMRQWQAFLRRPEVRGRAIFVEDYDLTVGAQFTRGVDVWLNTPRRPWEACGTSGMKVLVNGGLNLSELDGWWAEAYEPDVGWSLGDGREHPEAGWDAVEARELYRVLEEDVIPCFYRRDARGLPREWLARMRESMARLTTRFSSNRMLREYVERYYLPLADRVRERTAARAAELDRWLATLAREWPNVRFGALEIKRSGEGYELEVPVSIGQLDPAAVRVELYANPIGDGEPEHHPLVPTGQLDGGAALYVGTSPSRRPAGDYTPRILPAHEDLAVPLETGLIKWYR